MTIVWSGTLERQGQCPNLLGPESRPSPLAPLIRESTQYKPHGGKVPPKVAALKIVRRRAGESGLW